MTKSIREEKLPVSSLSFLPLEGIRTFTEALSVGVLLVDAEGVLYLSRTPNCATVSVM